jgi:hypothetical protein
VFEVYSYKSSPIFRRDIITYKTLRGDGPSLLKENKGEMKEKREQLWMKIHAECFTLLLQVWEVPSSVLSSETSSADRDVDDLPHFPSINSVLSYLTISKTTSFHILPTTSFTNYPHTPSYMPSTIKQGVLGRTNHLLSLIRNVLPSRCLATIVGFLQSCCLATTG